MPKASFFLVRLFLIVTVVTMTGCQSEAPLPLITIRAGTLLAEPRLNPPASDGPDTSRIGLAVGDTVSLMGQRTIRVSGHGRPASQALWFQVKHRDVSGWLPANHFAIFGDPRVEAAMHMASLPPSPRLHRRPSGSPRLTLSEKTGNWFTRWYYKNFGTDQQATSVLLYEASDPYPPKVHLFVLKTIGREDSGPLHLSQVCRVWEEVHDNWTYVTDARNTLHFASATTTIEVGLKGAADDFSILMAAALSAIGAETIIRIVDGELEDHVFTELELGDEKTAQAAVYYLAARYHKEPPVIARGIKRRDGRFYLNLDWFADHPGGDYADYDTQLVIRP